MDERVDSEEYYTTLELPGCRLEDIAWGRAWGEKTGDYEPLAKAAVGRIYQHHLASGHRSFGIVSAWRPERKRHENYAATGRLLHDIKSLGHGHIRMHGMGQQEGGGVSRGEPSFFVPGMPREHAIKLGKKYKQYSVIYADPDTRGEVWHHRLSDGAIENRWDRLHAKATSKYYSRLRGGHTFVFGSSTEPDSDLRRSWVDYVSVGWSEGLSLHWAEARARKALGLPPRGLLVLKAGEVR